MNSYEQEILDYLSLYRNKGHDFYSINDLLKKYDATILYFKDCYNFILAEYDNDLWIRKVIDDIISKDTFKSYVEHSNFIIEVFKRDEEFKLMTIEISREHTKSWWQKRILKKAGILYVDDIKIFFGKEIEVCDSNE